jgi:uncharacterized membrane protein HdeD (DUF308 family)
MSSNTSTADSTSLLRSRQLWLPSVLAGFVTVLIGIAMLSWPDATVRVVGALFGLNLLITGLVRAGLCLVSTSYPSLYRVLGVVFGVFIAIIGIVCLRNVAASAVLLILIVAIGWLLEGVVEIAAGVLGANDPTRKWRIADGVLSAGAAIIILVWPALSLRTFLALGAVLLILVGLAQIALSIGTARATRER